MLHIHYCQQLTRYLTSSKSVSALAQQPFQKIAKWKQKMTDFGWICHCSSLYCENAWLKNIAMLRCHWERLYCQPKKSLGKPCMDTDFRERERKREASASMRVQFQETPLNTRIQVVSNQAECMHAHLNYTFVSSPVPSIYFRSNKLSIHATICPSIILGQFTVYTVKKTSKNYSTCMPRYPLGVPDSTMDTWNRGYRGHLLKDRGTTVVLLHKDKTEVCFMFPMFNVNRHPSFYGIRG